MTAFMDMEVSELPPTHKLCYLGGCNFARNGVARDWQGNEVPANTPRFEHRVPDVTARAGFTDDIGFPADEDCTLIMPLKHDLSAFRVVERPVTTQ